jgi:hypothetical protein
VDALKLLRPVAGLAVVQMEPTPDIGSTAEINAVPIKWAGVDGDGDVEGMEAGGK